MVKYENECVSCGFPCIIGCRYKRVPHYYCDECDSEVDNIDALYKFAGMQICEECVLGHFEKAEE